MVKCIYCYYVIQVFSGTDGVSARWDMVEQWPSPLISEGWEYALMGDLYVLCTVSNASCDNITSIKAPSLDAIVLSMNRCSVSNKLNVHAGLYQIPHFLSPKDLVSKSKILFKL